MAPVKTQTSRMCTTAAVSTSRDYQHSEQGDPARFKQGLRRAKPRWSTRRRPHTYPGGQSTLTRALGLKIGRIVIDAGHGGHDTGTIGPTGFDGKRPVPGRGAAAGQTDPTEIAGYGNCIYPLGRHIYSPRRADAHRERNPKADLFISIHANSSPDHGARGVETYYLNMRGSAGGDGSRRA